MKRLICGIALLGFGFGVYLISAGCNVYDWHTKPPVISSRTQTLEQRESRVAQYVIRSYCPNGNTSSCTIIMPEDFGRAGDIVIFSNGVMCAVGPKAEK